MLKDALKTAIKKMFTTDQIHVVMHLVTKHGFEVKIVQLEKDGKQILVNREGQVADVDIFKVSDGVGPH